MKPQGYVETPDEMNYDVASKESFYHGGEIFCTHDNLSGKETATLIALAIKYLIPYLGDTEIHFKHLNVVCDVVDIELNGATRKFFILEHLDLAKCVLGAEIFLNLKTLICGEVLLSTFVHELAHVLTIRPFSLLHKSFDNGGHNSDFCNTNLRLLKYVKRIDFFQKYFDMQHPSMNAFLTVTYTQQ
jgi:hypothetical protein